MNASKFVMAIAALVFAGSAAADVPVANAAASSAAVAAAAQSVAAPVKPAALSRAEVRAEAIEALKTHRATEAGQADWFMKQGR